MNDKLVPTGAFRDACNDTGVFEGGSNDGHLRREGDGFEGPMLSGFAVNQRYGRRVFLRAELLCRFPIHRRCRTK